MEHRNNNRYISFIVLGYLLIQTPMVFSAGAEESSEFKKEIREELLEIKREIKGLRRLIESRFPRQSSSLSSRPARPVTGKTDIKDDPFLGRTDSPLVLVEFSDFQCPFCGRFFRGTLPQLKKNFIDTGKLRYVFKDFPIPNHKLAHKAAEASHCAGEKGKYWEMHDLMFENQQGLGINNLIKHAAKLGLKVEDFKRCIQDGRYAKGIKKDIEAGRSGGRVTGTPSFILGKVNDKGEVEGKIMRGAKPYKTFKATIEAMLKKKDKTLLQLN